MFNNISIMILRDEKTTTVKRELSQVSLDAFQMKQRYVKPGTGSECIHSYEIMFENTSSVHLTVYRGNNRQ